MGSLRLAPINQRRRDTRMRHVRSCMPTRCIRPFLAVNAEAILGWLTVWGLGCLLQSSKHCSPIADPFLWDVLQMLLSMTGDDSYFVTPSCTVTKAIVKSWFKVSTQIFPMAAILNAPSKSKMVVSCLLWCIIITILYYTCTEASAPSVPSLATVFGSTLFPGLGYLKM